MPTKGALVLIGLPVAETVALVDGLAVYGIVPLRREGDLLQFELFQDAFEIVLEWACLVPDRVLEEGQYLHLASGESLSFAHLGRTKPLSSLVKRLKNAWVLEMVRENRFTTHYQPIFLTRNLDVIHAHECLMRGVEPTGATIPPGKVLDAADEEGLVFHLDRLCRINAIKGFAAQGVAGKTFINFNPVSIYNPVTCLQSTVVAANSVGLTPDRIVFELIERNHVADEAHLLRIVDFYRAAGYGIALDDVGAGYSGLNLLTSLEPDYIKLDMHLIRNVDTDPVRQGVVGNMLEMARKLGILSIVEGVETEGEYEFVLREGADFVQGYLFAKPSARAHAAPDAAIAA